jgi:hypothetical protein
MIYYQVKPGERPVADENIGKSAFYNGLLLWKGLLMNYWHVVGFSPWKNGPHL